MVDYIDRQQIIRRAKFEDTFEAIEAALNPSEKLGEDRLEGENIEDKGGIGEDHLSYVDLPDRINYDNSLAERVV